MPREPSRYRPHTARGELSASGRNEDTPSANPPAPRGSPRNLSSSLGFPEPHRSGPDRQREVGRAGQNAKQGRVWRPCEVHPEQAPGTWRSGRRGGGAARPPQPADLRTLQGPGAHSPNPVKPMVTASCGSGPDASEPVTGREEEREGASLARRPRSPARPGPPRPARLTGPTFAGPRALHRRRPPQSRHSSPHSPAGAAPRARPEVTARSAGGATAQSGAFRGGTAASAQRRPGGREERERAAPRSLSTRPGTSPRVSDTLYTSGATTATVTNPHGILKKTLLSSLALHPTVFHLLSIF